MANKVKDRIENILAVKAWTRENDMDLLFEYWEEYLGVYLSLAEKQRIKKGPSAHTIFRHRAYIQNTEGLFKGSEESQIQRIKAENEFRENYSPIKSELTREERRQKREKIRDGLKN